MTRPALTVLTAPILPAPQRAYQRARRALRPLVKPGIAPPATTPYPGHYALTRSVVEGLRAIRADFNFNPTRLSDLSRVVYAPANEALRQAAALKREGAIDYLVAGPVNALFADESDGVLRLPEIDRLIVACEWARDLLADAPQLVEKSRVCPCGVDADVWTPSPGAKPKAVVYWKSGAESFCREVEAIVRARGLEPVVVASAHGDHARFTPASFRQALDASVVSVFLSTFETQGIALAEAWSMDVPTIVWNPCGQAEWRGRSFHSSSSCPYLMPATGLAWRTLDECGAALDEALRHRGRFQPRQWVLDHMTDAICSRQLYDIILSGAHMMAGAR
ncbi:MAG: hypothetical protein ACHQO8_12415 [Vicinamibacterales bacterium]